MKVFSKPKDCTEWHKESAKWLEEASFLTINPLGIFYNGNGDQCEFCALPDPESEWCLRANFADKPYWIVAQFDAEHRDAAFQSLLNWKQGRPIFYLDPYSVVRIRSRTLARLYDELRAEDIDLEEDRDSEPTEAELKKCGLSERKRAMAQDLAMSIHPLGD